MADAEIRAIVNADSLRSLSDGVTEKIGMSPRGELLVVDFYTRLALEGRIFEVRLGTITTPLTGDVNITDAAAEASTDAATGMTIIPLYLNVDLESFAGGTLPECTAKGVAAVSTSGGVFVALPRMTGGNAATQVSRVAAAGGVAVPAELATTTNRYFGNRVTAQADRILADHAFLPPPVLKGPACFYVQIAATTAGSVYFANYDYAEIPTTSL